MTSLKTLSVLPLGLALACAPSKYLPPIPTTHVTDDQRLLNKETWVHLERQLHAYEQRSHHQIYVWITDSTHKEAYPDFTLRVFNAWGVGREQHDDGVLLFVFVKDDMRWITVGYGLEAAIPDREAVRICREVIAPAMRAGDPDKGISAGVDQIIAAIDAWESK